MRNCFAAYRQRRVDLWYRWILAQCCISPSSHHAGSSILTTEFCSRVKPDLMIKILVHPSWHVTWINMKHEETKRLLFYVRILGNNSISRFKRYTASERRTTRRIFHKMRRDNSSRVESERFEPSTVRAAGNDVPSLLVSRWRAECLVIRRR